MKRFLLTNLAILLATTIVSPSAYARTQTDLSDLAADGNGDGRVTLSELKRYNRAIRDK